MFICNEVTSFGETCVLLDESVPLNSQFRSVYKSQVSFFVSGPYNFNYYYCNDIGSIFWAKTLLVLL